MNVLAPVGRLLFSVIFIFSGVNHFIHVNDMVGHVQSSGLPAPRLAILGSGALLVVCGVCVLLGIATRLCAALLALFLVTAAVTMHPFWGLPDPQAAQMQFIHFMKNLSMAGGALLITYFGPGPYALQVPRGIEVPPPRYILRFRRRAPA